MTSLNLAHVHHDTQQVVRTGPLQLHALPVVLAHPIRIWQHVELERELDWVVNFGSGPVMAALPVLEPLQRMLAICGFAGWRTATPRTPTLSCIDNTLGKRLTLVYLRACWVELQLLHRYSHLSDLMYSSSRHSLSVSTGFFWPVFLIRFCTRFSSPRLRSRKDCTELVFPEQF